LPAFAENLTHTLLMVGKAKLGILEAFQPYQSLQIALSYLTGDYIPPLVPWPLSYINGSTAAGFIFANLYHRLPSNSGPIKGFIAGVLGWLVMDSDFLSVAGAWPVCNSCRPRPLASAVLSRNDAGLQHRIGPRLRHDRCGT
jgi:hypothetical protein